MTAKFKVGDLVTLITHPLFDNARVKGDGKYIPPIMIIKEVFVEDKKKRIFSEETGKKIADNIKYKTLFFDDNKSEFVESTIYQTMLRTFEELIIERIDKKGNTEDIKDKLVDEINNYPRVEYDYGKIVRFKTKKIEIYKKRSSKRIPAKEDKILKEKIKEIVQYVVNYTSPDFIISGYKLNEETNLYFPNGNEKRLVSMELLKVQWFNPIQMKFSEQYLPIECFTDSMNLSEVDNNKKNHSK